LPVRTILGERRCQPEANPPAKVRCAERAQKDGKEGQTTDVTDSTDEEGPFRLFSVLSVSSVVKNSRLVAVECSGFALTLKRGERKLIDSGQCGNRRGQCSGTSGWLRLSLRSSHSRRIRFTRGAVGDRVGRATGTTTSAIAVTTTPTRERTFRRTIAARRGRARVPHAPIRPRASRPSRRRQLPPRPRP